MAARLIILSLVLLASPGLASSQPALTREQAQQIQRDCATIDQCIAAMRTETAVNFSSILEHKFADFGEPAVEPLMAVLTGDPDARMRSYAGMALSRMPRIDARHLPALIAESRRGNPAAFLDAGPAWLAIPIGLVRDNREALIYLFDLVEMYGARATSNAVQPAIERSSRAVWLEEARRRLEGFAPQQSADYLYVLCQLVRHGGWPRPDPSATPAWFEPALVRIATDPTMNAEARAVAQEQLRPFQNHIALAALIDDARAQVSATPQWDGASRFVTIADQWERISDGNIERTVRELARFGEAALDAAPLIRPFLSRPDLPDTRAQAALALAAIGDRDSIPALIAALGDRDDWLLAYNAAEALGRLRAEAALEPLRQVATSHWSPAVRNNARRALNMIDRGAFVRPEAPSETGINAGEQEYLYFGPLRFGADRFGEEADCMKDGQQRRLPQTPRGALRFPARGAYEIVTGEIASADLLQLSPNIREQVPRGDVTAIKRLPHGVLIATDGGEFIGGLAFVPDGGGAVALVVPDNVTLLFRHGGRLYALTGLSHLSMSYGEVWEIDARSSTPRAVRRIRLPSEVAHVYATARHDIAFATTEGTFLLSEDGALRDGGDQSTCQAR